MALAPTTRLGTYEILGPLGAGGMGEVYRARDLRLGREIAIKVLPSDVDSSPARLARLEREARIAAGLNHPNIVTLFSLEDENGVRFLTMELVEGEPLSSLIPSGGLPFTRLLEIAIPLTDALVVAHERRVTHRDLKPGNVMVTHDGRVKVLDFGLAKMTRAEAGDGSPPSDRTRTATLDVPLTARGHVPGTVPYMAPEQIRGEEIDSKSDVFALGVILYELAAGRRPFLGSTSLEIASSILRDDPEPLTRTRRDLPVDYERIVSQCLKKDPRERALSARDVSKRLRQLSSDLARGNTRKETTGKVASIAVLPFVNRSASADDEYFSDGLADELLNVLSKIKSLHVPARSSSFHYKGKDVPLAEIGRTLHVATVLEGSVRKVENRVRITVQLVKVPEGHHLWSEVYDRTLDDIFAVQDDIAQSVVKELRTALLGEREAGGRAKADVSRAAKGRSTDPEAHRLYLLGRYFLDRYTREDTTKAIEHLKQALERSPDFALAWVELSRAYALEGMYGWGPMQERFEQSRKAVERSLELERDLPEGHAQMGWILTVRDWDWKGAETSFARAIELAPGNAQALRWMAGLVGNLGRLDEAIDLFHRSLERDPVSASTYNNLGLALFAADRWPDAEQAYRRALELAPQRAVSHNNLALTLLALGRGEEALVEAMKEPADWGRRFALALVHHGLGHAAESDAALRELIDHNADDSAKQIAEVYAVRGEIEAAFEWLDRAFANRDGPLVEAKVSPYFRPLHGDPRWSAFLAGMGLQDR